MLTSQEPQGGVPGHKVLAVKEGLAGLALQGGGQASWTGTCICLTGLLLRPGVLKIFERSFSQFGFSSTFFNPTFSSIPPTADWSELFPAGSVSTAQLGCTFCPLDGYEIC